MIIAVAKMEFLQIFSAKLDVALSEMAWQLIRLVWNKLMYLKFLPIGGYTTWKCIYRFTKDVKDEKSVLKFMQPCDDGVVTVCEVSLDFKSSFKIFAQMARTQLFALTFF